MALQSGGNNRGAFAAFFFFFPFFFLSYVSPRSHSSHGEGFELPTSPFGMHCAHGEVGREGLGNVQDVGEENTLLMFFAAISRKPKAEGGLSVRAHAHTQPHTERLTHPHLQVVSITAQCGKMIDEIVKLYTRNTPG